MPELEKLELLAAHRSTLCLFLASITLLRDVTASLIPSYGADCPVAVVHKASLSCPDQKIVLGTLGDIPGESARRRTQVAVDDPRRPRAHCDLVRELEALRPGSSATATCRAVKAQSGRHRRGSPQGALPPLPPSEGANERRSRCAGRRSGPGDPALLTLRAAELLRLADVVAYDELVSESILALVPETAELLPVGRRAGQRHPAHRIHPEVIERAQRGLLRRPAQSGRSAGVRPRR